jgi:hypothetical protein
MDYINPLNLVTDFKPEQNVRFIPRHLIVEYFESPTPTEFGDFGIVKSVTDKYVFVRYYRHGVLQHNAHATDPRDLINDTKPTSVKYDPLY